MASVNFSKPTVSSTIAWICSRVIGSKLEMKQPGRDMSCSVILSYLQERNQTRYSSNLYIGTRRSVAVKIISRHACCYGTSRKVNLVPAVDGLVRALEEAEFDVLGDFDGRQGLRKHTIDVRT